MLGMPHHLLERKQITASLEHQGGEGVSEPVGGEIDPAPGAQACEHPLESSCGQGSVVANGAEEEGRGLTGSLALPEVLEQDLTQGPQEGDHPVLGSLAAAYVDHAVDQVHVADQQVSCLAQPQAGVEHHSDQGLIAVALQPVAGGAVEGKGQKALGVLFGDPLGELLFQSGPLDPLQRVHRQVSLLHRPRKKRPQGAVLVGEGVGGPSAQALVVQVAAQVLEARILEGLNLALGEVAHEHAKGMLPPADGAGTVVGHLRLEAEVLVQVENWGRDHGSRGY